MTEKTVFKTLPGVLSFKRGHVISDALMFNQLPDETETPLEIYRHGIRGTQNVSGGKDKAVANIQITETAKLDNNTNIMIVRFSLAFLPITEALNSCASNKNKEEARALRDSIEDFLKRAQKSKGLLEVACRYGRNIANGRWLWRNRPIAADISITVKNSLDDLIIGPFNAFDISLNHFENYSKEEILLGEEIARQMSGISKGSLMVKAKVILRAQGAEVFPSQNYIESKPSGFAKSLYKVGHAESFDETDIRMMGQAAIRDQKVFNAIRTIDTWYPYFEEEKIPISVEPNGANLKMQEFFRSKENSSFELFKRLNIIDPDSNEGMFCIACFDRGGVYSETEKNKAKDQE